MTDLTHDRSTYRRDGDIYLFPVATGVKCYMGGIAVLNATGYAKPAVTATGLITVGRFEETVDNTSGADGAVNVNIRRGIFKYSNSASTDAITKAQIGDLCYLVDDATVAKTDATGTRSGAGYIVDVESDGVWVEMESYR